jgi:hypothetical protein
LAVERFVDPVLEWFGGFLPGGHLLTINDNPVRPASKKVRGARTKSEYLNLRTG